MVTRLSSCLWWAYWLFMFVMTHLPRPPGGQLVERLGDKLVHTVAYFLLAFGGGWVRHRRRLPLDGRWFVRWWLIYTAYAAADELLQPFFGRFCQFSDWVADGIGATLALLITAWLWSERNRPARKARGHDVP